LRKIYRQVFHFGAGFKSRVQDLLEENKDFELAQRLLQFLAVDSRRGVCMPRVKGAKRAAAEP
jgi:acyl-[acyl carrier protein]--UDP-N-acetylglucosamine O-acyltransferase